MGGGVAANQRQPRGRAVTQPALLVRRRRYRSERRGEQDRREPLPPASRCLRAAAAAAAPCQPGVPSTATVPGQPVSEPVRDRRAQPP